jgi:hypothetical protein
MLPVPYFHITVTVPAELREVLRTHQRDGYAVLMQATAAWGCWRAAPHEGNLSEWLSPGPFGALPSLS